MLFDILRVMVSYLAKQQIVEGSYVSIAIVANDVYVRLGEDVFEGRVENFGGGGLIEALDLKELLEFVCDLQVLDCVLLETSYFSHDYK